MKTKENTHIWLSLARASALSITLLGIVGQVGAVVVDLTNPPLGTTGTIGGAIFESGSLDTSTGSGVFDPFVRVHDNDGEEEGFNTGGARMPDVVGGAHTKEVQLSSLRTVTLSGNDYVRLVLDLGEPSSGDKSLISLVDLRVFVQDTTVLDATNTTELFGGTPLFAFGAGDRVDLDYDLVSSGNGRSDMFFYLPVALFTSYQPDDYFYLYSKFGTTGNTAPPYPAEGTFEEWGSAREGRPIGFDNNPPGIPEPTSILFGATLAAVMGFSRRRPR